MEKDVLMYKTERNVKNWIGNWKLKNHIKEENV